MRRLRLSLFGSLLVGLLAFPPPAAAAPTFGSTDGIQVISQKPLDSRLIALSVSTSALNGPANVRVLLPSGYASHLHRRYPVLYLLHGTSGGASDWTTMGGAEQTTAGLPLIVVMPDIGQNDDGGGWCTDWYNSGAYGLPKWETFHIDQLIPWIDANLRTVASRKGRAIAGLSQGGFCSMSYAAQYPDLFSVALSYSGAPDIAYDAEAQALVTPVINATETGLDHVAPNSMFGPRNTNEINWAAHDPTTLAANLRWTKLYMYTGNGNRGPYDGLVPNPGASAIEAGVHELTILFHNRLNALGIPSLFDDYGGGTHSWPYWARDLRWSIGDIMTDFAHPPAGPSKVTYTSADPVYTQFGWRVITHRQVREFSTLVAANRTGFELQGSGSATVLTPRFYLKSARYRITTHTSTASSSRTEKPNRRGQLTIQVPLGPSNTVQEYPADGPATGTKVYTTNVTVIRLKTARKHHPRKHHRKHHR